MEKTFIYNKKKSKFNKKVHKNLIKIKCKNLRKEFQIKNLVLRKNTQKNVWKMENRQKNPEFQNSEEQQKNMNAEVKLLYFTN